MENFSGRKRLNSFVYAFNGIKTLLIREHNARIHSVALVSVVALGFLLDISLTEWMAITIVAGLVFLSELFNTAIERLADLVEPKKNQNIGLIKDYCAGAVLIAAVISFIVGGLIFIPKIMAIIQ